MALAANTIITQSSSAAYAPVAKTRDNTSPDQTSSFGDVLAQQDSTAASNAAQAPTQSADKATTSKNTQVGNKSGNTQQGNKPDNTQVGNKSDNTQVGNKPGNIQMGNKPGNTQIGNKAANNEIGNKSGNKFGDQTQTDAIATADTSQSTKVRGGKSADKAKSSTTDSKSASDAVNDNDNDTNNGANLTLQVPLAQPPSAPSTSQPSTAADASNLEAIGEATNGAKPAATGANDPNNTEAAQGTDEAQAADDAQSAEGTAASGKALSSNAFQKMLGATKAGTAKDSQAAKAAPDKDIKTADANVGSTNTLTNSTSDVNPTASTNVAMTNAASTAAEGDKSVTAASDAATPATTQSHTAPNLNSLAVEITTKAQSGAKQFDIRLDPPELGRVDVRLSIDATGKAQAHLSADQPQTLELLQKDAPALTQALRDAGLDVSQGGLNFSLKNQQQNSGGNNNPGQSNYDGATTTTASVISETASGGSAYTGGAGLLDIKI